MKLASYKGTRPGLAGLFNRAVRWWLGGKYSHTELVFSDGVSASSSWLDGGVRYRLITFDPAKWDLIEIDGDEQAARQWFKDHGGDSFDIVGLFGFVWRRSTHNRARWFCSESVAASLGFPDPYRFDPCSLPCVFKRVD